MAIDLEARTRERSQIIARKFPEHQVWKNVPFAKLISGVPVNYSNPCKIPVSGNGYHPESKAPEKAKELIESANAAVDAYRKIQNP